MAQYDDILGDLIGAPSKPKTAYQLAKEAYNAKNAIDGPPVQGNGRIAFLSGSEEEMRLYTAKAQARPKEALLSDEQQELICSGIRQGLTITRICLHPDLPHHEVVQRALRSPAYGKFRKAYYDAKHDQAAVFADMALDVAQNTDIPKERAKMIIDVLKWQAAKLDPRRYGDKVEHSIQGDSNNPIQVQHTDTASLTQKSTAELLEYVRHAASSSN